MYMVPSCTAKMLLSCTAREVLWAENRQMHVTYSWKYVEHICVGQFSHLKSTDGSLCKKIWFNNKQLCIYASTASEVATPAETLTANL